MLQYTVLLLFIYLCVCECVTKLYIVCTAYHLELVFHLCPNTNLYTIVQFSHKDILTSFYLVLIGILRIRIQSLNSHL